MSKRTEKPLLLYCLPDAKVDKIVNDYIDYVMNPYHEWRQTEKWLDDEFENGFSMGNKPAPEKYEHLPERQPLRQRGEFDGREPIYQLEHKPQRNRTEYAFRALIDMLYRLYEQSEAGWFTLSKEVLAEVFYEGYPYMITTLSRNNVINGEGNQYTRLITLQEPELYELKETRKADYNCIVPYRLRAAEVINAYYKKKKSVGLVRQLSDTLGNDMDSFIRSYQENLSLIKFIDNDALSNYINNWTYFKSDSRKAHYRAFVNKVNCQNGYLPEEKIEIKMGKNESEQPIGRIYHIGTSMPKSLKKYSNLLYGIDAHNSHPVLFNIFLLEYYINNRLFSIYDNFIDIEDSSLFYLLSSIIISSSPYSYNQYVLEYLTKALLNNNIEGVHFDKIRKIPEDVFRYIYDTSTGRIWDNIQSCFPQYTRNQVKEKCFRNVFYSYLTEKEGKRKKEWTSLFKLCYPSVWKVINEYKIALHQECLRNNEINTKTDDEGNTKGKDKIQLPHLLMRFESVVFTRALNDAFKAKIPAISIHDCISVIGNAIDEPQQNKLKQIILNRYKEVGIIPALSVEEYD